MRLIGTSAAARHAQRSAQTMLNWAKSGKVKSILTEDGRRLFDVRDLERLVLELNRQRSGPTKAFRSRVMA
jgi:predicted site-specific integrase-resolvase